MNTRQIGCGGLQILTAEETETTAAELGITQEEAELPTELELENEYKLEHIGYDEYVTECGKYGYTPVAA